MLACPTDAGPFTNGHYASGFRSPSRAQRLLYSRDIVVRDTRGERVVLGGILR